MYSGHVKVDEKRTSKKVREAMLATPIMGLRKLDLLWRGDISCFLSLSIPLFPHPLGYPKHYKLLNSQRRRWMEGMVDSRGDDFCPSLRHSRYYYGIMWRGAHEWDALTGKEDTLSFSRSI
jgi:hypothetical protein